MSICFVCRNKDASISKFRFPNPKFLDRHGVFEQWIQFTKSEKLKTMSYDETYKSVRICGRHFKADDVNQDFARVTLKWTAVPSLNPPEQIDLNQNMEKNNIIDSDLSDNDIEIISNQQHTSSNVSKTLKVLDTTSNKQASAEEILAAYDFEIKQVKQEQKRLAERLQELMSAREKAYEAYMTKKSESLAQKNWTSENYDWTPRVKRVLKDTFKLDTFRQKQLEAINATLSGNDLILLMPTGGGKSLCYQLPALVSNGLTLVISPLVSLMEDQVMALKELNVPVEMLNASVDKTVVKSIHDSLMNRSKLKLLYVTPERMAKSKRFMSCLQKCYLRKGLDRIAIDEVHCCSQWGHDFRPDYKFLGVLRSMFPDTPIIGLTATATSRILVDVQKMLDLSGCLVLKASFNRPNLYYEVRLKPPSQEDCVMLIEDLLKNRYKGKSGIIYTISIKDSVDLVTQLRERGLKVACYHADLDPETRSNIHSKWKIQYYQAVVATVAFGMGIDKPDVRFVIHHSLAKSMENFYQESGRAGRDSKPADCILLFRINDVFRLSTMVFSTNTGLSNLYGMVEYCIDANRCRRSIIATHFDEVWEAQQCNGMCDHCKHPKEVRSIDITEYTRQIYTLLAHSASLDVRLTCIKLLDAWFHKGDKKLRTEKVKPPAISRNLGENILAYLLIKDYLNEDFHFTAYTTISYIKRGQKAALLTDKNYTIKMNIPGKSVQENERIKDTKKIKDREYRESKKRSQSTETSISKKLKSETRENKKEPSKELKELITSFSGSD